VFCKLKWKKLQKMMYLDLYSNCGRKMVSKTTYTADQQHTRNWQWSKDYTEFKTIALKKKPKTTKCDDNSTISIVAHRAKIRIIIRGKIEDVLDLE